MFLGRQRASTTSGVGDTVVNQLLAKMDGVDEINNILIIGMTNRKDLLDKALLRPGTPSTHHVIFFILFRFGGFLSVSFSGQPACLHAHVSTARSREPTTNHPSQTRLVSFSSY